MTAIFFSKVKLDEAWSFFSFNIASLIIDFHRRYVALPNVKLSGSLFGNILDVIVLIQFFFVTFGLLCYEYVYFILTWVNYYHVTK